MIIFLIQEKQPVDLSVDSLSMMGAGKAPNPEPPVHNSTTSTHQIVTNPAFWMFCAAAMLMAAAMFGPREHMILFLRSLNYSPAVSAAVLSSIFVVSLFGRFISGPLSDKFSARRVIVLNFLLCGLSLTLLQSGSDFLLLYLFPILFGLNYGAIINLTPLVVFESFGVRKVGKAYGLAAGCFLFGSAGGPFLIGRIFDQTHSYRLPFLADLALGFIAMIAILAFAWKRGVSGLTLEQARNGLEPELRRGMPSDSPSLAHPGQLKTPARLRPGSQEE